MGQVVCHDMFGVWRLIAGGNMDHGEGGETVFSLPILLAVWSLRVASVSSCHRGNLYRHRKLHGRLSLGTILIYGPNFDL